MANDSKAKSIFAKNMKRLLSLKDITQKDAAKDLGIAYQTFNNWCKGTSIPGDLDTIDELANYFGCSRSDLLEPANATIARSAVRIPVLGSVPAGIPIEAIEDIIDYEEIPSAMAEKGDYFALKIKGHSMEPQIMDGDVVIVRKTDDVDSGDVAIVMVNGDDATCKKVVKQSSGVQLVPINPDFDPLFFSNEEIASKPVRVIGRVSEIRRTL